MIGKAPFPVISCEGNPYDIGCQYGVQARSLIESAAESYHKIFQDMGVKVEWREISDLAKRFESHIKEYDADALEEMRGIADGSGVSYEDIMIVNLRTEFRSLGRVQMDADGCTVIVATPETTANHHMLMAQNCDMNPRALPSQVIVKKKKKGKPATIAVHDAGMLIKTGFNSAGLVCLGNGLFRDEKIQIGVPSHILVYGILTAENVCEALLRCLPEKRTMSSNKVIGSRQGLCVDVEVAADFENFIMPEDGILVHTNHFVCEPKGRDMGPLIIPNTITRRHRALQLLEAERGNITVDTLKKVLTDHLDKPDSICDHVNLKNPFIQSQTNASVIIDLEDLFFCIEFKIEEL